MTFAVMPFALICQESRKLLACFIWSMLGNTKLYHGNPVIDGILAVLLQPCMDNAHESVDIKRHQIFLFGRRNVETVKNRREYMAFPLR